MAALGVLLDSSAASDTVPEAVDAEHASEAAVAACEAVDCDAVASAVSACSVAVEAVYEESDTLEEGHAYGPGEAVEGHEAAPEEGHVTGTAADGSFVDLA